MRLGTALRALPASIIRPRQPAHEGHWVPAMTWLALGTLLLTAAALPIDEAAIRLVRENPSAILQTMARITDLGQAHWYLVPSALAIVALGLMDWTARDSRHLARLSAMFAQAAFAFGAVAISGILVNVIKLFFGRSRPRLIDDGGPFQFDPFSMSHLFQSFPSGHSTTCGAVAMVLIIWFPRWWLPILAAGFALALSRIAAQAHYPSDVLAGFGLGALYTLHLSRWLAVRGRAFRIATGRLLPIPRHMRGWLARGRGGLDANEKLRK